MKNKFKLFLTFNYILIFSLNILFSIDIKPDQITQMQITAIQEKLKNQAVSKAEIKDKKGEHFIKYNDDNYYIASGNVILFNLESNDELRTEELFWYPNDEKFETQKFVTIKTNNEIHSGEGMESNQDFSNYKILRPTGTIEIDEN